MNKATVLTVIALLVLLAACGGKQMTAKPLAKSSTPTGDTVIRPPTPTATQAPAPETSMKTAAEALKELQQTQLQQAAAAVGKSGLTTFSAPPNATAKSKGEARKLLLERTRSAFRTGSTVSQPTKAVTTFTSYYSRSGSSINLPKEYQSATHD